MATTILWTQYGFGYVDEVEVDPSSKNPFSCLRDERVGAAERHVLAFADPEAPFPLELARRLGRERCYFVEWPETTLSFPEVVTRYGHLKASEIVSDARPYPLEGVFTTTDLMGEIATLYRTGSVRGVSTGWWTLDDYYRVRAGELTIVTGVPGHGKSNWLDALAVNLAIREDWPIAFFSPENQPLQDHMARVLEKFVGMPFEDGPTPRMDERQLGRAIEWASERMVWMLPSDEDSWRIEWILARAKELVYRHGIKGLVIDPWNELSHDREKGETETDQVSRTLRVIRQFARQNGVHVWLVVHPTKLRRDDRTGEYPVPTLYDCAGSAHFRNKADNGICIWRDVQGGGPEVHVHVQKIRFRQNGRVGVVALWYDPPTGTYSPIGRAS